MGVQDLLGISEPLVKLIDVVSKGIGTVYEHRAIKKNAKAKAEEIGIITKSIRDNLDVLVKYEQGNITIEPGDLATVEGRSIVRQHHVETKRQENIEAIVEKAGEILLQEDNVTDEPLSDDWISRFFNTAQDVSEEEMQNLWSQILAGEIKQPNTYSLRTLETLKCLCSKDAQNFMEVAKYVVDGNSIPRIDITRSALSSELEEDLVKLEGLHSYEQFTLDFEVILALAEAGIVHTGSFISRRIEGEEVLLHCGDYVLKVTNPNMKMVFYHQYPLTKVGRELIKLINPKVDKDFLIQLAETLKLQGCTVSYGELVLQGNDYDIRNEIEI